MSAEPDCRTRSTAVGRRASAAAGRARLTRLTALALAALAVLAAAPQPAGAHAVLVRSDPPAGARLTDAPERITLHFTERFVQGSQRVTVRAGDGGGLRLPPAQAGGRVVRQELPERLPGSTAVVSWRVLSEDGHVAVGELAFAVGPDAAIPRVTAESGAPRWLEVIASWLFFGGLSLSLGGLASQRLVWRDSAAVRAPVRSGALLVVVASTGHLLLMLERQVAGAGDVRQTLAALDAAVTSRPVTLTVLVIAAGACAAVLIVFRRWKAAAAALAAAAMASAARGHSGTSGHVWAVVADAAHLVAAAIWAGALLHLVLIVGSACRGSATGALAPALRRYAQGAVAAVIVVMATGAVTALAQFGAPADLVQTDYGRVLLVKSALVALALGLALAARRRGLPRRGAPRLPPLRRLAGAEITVLAGALLVAAALVHVAPPQAPAEASRSVVGPPPIAGPAVRLAGFAGQLAVGLTAGREQLRFQILTPTTAEPQTDLEARIQRPGMRPARLYPRRCGPGCFTIRFRLPRRQTSTIDVAASAPAWRGGRTRFRVSWPPGPDRSRLLRRVVQRMRTVPELQLVNSTTSGFGPAPAPVRATVSGRAFMKTELYTRGAVDVRVVERRGGLTTLAFALAASDIWYRTTVDQRKRIRSEVIVNRGHLVRLRFHYSSRSDAP